jgi:hypothetical protein
MKQKHYFCFAEGHADPNLSEAVPGDLWLVLKKPVDLVLSSFQEKKQKH